MRISTNATIVLIGACILIVLIGVALWLPRANKVANANTTVFEANINASQLQLQKDINALINARWNGITEERIELLGSSLINVPDGALAQQLSTDSKIKTHVTYAERMTSRDGIGLVAALLSEKPPRYLVLDLGRYDAQNDIPLDVTMSNISMIVSKASSTGVIPVVLGGVGSDGSINLASSLSLTAGTTGRFIDVSLLLLDPLLRVSPTELNADGTVKLSGLIAQALKQP